MTSGRLRMECDWKARRAWGYLAAPDIASLGTDYCRFMKVKHNGCLIVQEVPISYCKCVFYPRVLWPDNLK